MFKFPILVALFVTSAAHCQDGPTGWVQLQSPLNRGLVTTRGIKDVVVHDRVKKAGYQNKLHVQYFHAKWCLPCGKMRPEILKVARDIKVFTFDVDNDQVYSNAVEVSSVPTTIIFDEGVEVKRFEGFRTAGQLSAWLKEYRNKNLPTPKPVPDDEPDGLDGGLDFVVPEDEVDYELA